MLVTLLCDGCNAALPYDVRGRIAPRVPPGEPGRLVLEQADGPTECPVCGITINPAIVAKAVSRRLLAAAESAGSDGDTA